MADATRPWATWVGAVIIIASGLYVIYREHRNALESVDRQRTDDTPQAT